MPSVPTAVLRRPTPAPADPRGVPGDSAAGTDLTLEQVVTRFHHAVLSDTALRGYVEGTPLAAVYAAHAACVDAYLGGDPLTTPDGGRYRPAALALVHTHLAAALTAADHASDGAPRA
jgi:truncated hemoglobin YjbI